MSPPRSPQPPVWKTVPGTPPANGKNRSSLKSSPRIAASTPAPESLERRISIAAGIGGPLTGPAARGDVETVRAHLQRLAEQSPEDAETHRLLSLRLARLALELGEPGAARTRAKLAGRHWKPEV